MKVFKTLDKLGVASAFNKFADALKLLFASQEDVIASSLNDLDRRTDDAEKRCTTMEGHYTPSNGSPVKPTTLTNPFGQFISSIETDDKGHITGITSNPIANLSYDNTTGAETDAPSEDEAEKGTLPLSRNGQFTFKFWSTKQTVTKDVYNVSVELLGTAGGMAGNLYDSLKIQFLMNITNTELITASGRKTLEAQECFYFRPSNPMNKIIAKDVKVLSYPHKVTFYPDSSSTNMWVMIDGVFMSNLNGTDIETMLSSMSGYLCLRDNP